MNVREAFATLGLDPTDDVEAIQGAYKHLAKQLHPDVQRASGAKPSVMVHDMRLVNQARDILVDAARRGSLVVAAGHPIDQPSPQAQAVDDLWERGAPARTVPRARAPIRRLEPWAERSRRAALRWLWVAAGLAASVLVLAVVRLPGLDQALSPSPSTEDLAVVASGATEDRYSLRLLFQVLQTMFPICLIKWCIVRHRSRGTGTGGPGAIALTVAMVAMLVPLFWGFAPTARHREALLAGTMTPQGYTDAMA